MKASFTEATLVTPDSGMGPFRVAVAVGDSASDQHVGVLAGPDNAAQGRCSAEDVVHAQRHPCEPERGEGIPAAGGADSSIAP